MRLPLGRFSHSAPGIVISKVLIIGGMLILFAFSILKITYAINSQHLNKAVPVGPFLIHSK